jgi:hypothetical protein
MAITLGLAALATLLLGLGQQWPLPILVYLGLRFLSDLSAAISHSRENGRRTTAVLAAMSWTYLPLGVDWMIRHSFLTDAATWVIGAGILLGGLTLLAHQERLHHQEHRTSRLLGSLGTIAASVGAGLVALGLSPTALGWPAAAIAALATLTVLYLIRPRTGQDDQTDTSWLKTHRLRGLLVLLPVPAYLLARGHLAGLPLIFPLWTWEFTAAALYVAFILWSLRNQLRPYLLDDPLQSGHTRHEPSIKRNSERGFDDWETALTQFVTRGEKHALGRLVEQMETEERVPARTAFSAVLGLRTRSWVLLLHPAWSYAAQGITLLLVAWVLLDHGDRLNTLLDAPILTQGGEMLALLFLSVGLFAMQFNRHGGPWVIRSLCGFAGVALFLLAGRPLLETELTMMGLENPTALILILATLLALVPLLHAVPSRRPTPRYAYNGGEPEQALDETLRHTTRMLLSRLVFLGGTAALALALAIGLSRLHPAFELIFGVYLLFAIPLLVIPIISFLGLRLGRRRLEKTTRMQTTQRRHHLEEALLRLEQAYKEKQEHDRIGASSRPRTT